MTQGTTFKCGTADVENLKLPLPASFQTRQGTTFKCGTADDGSLQLPLPASFYTRQGTYFQMRSSGRQILRHKAQGLEFSHSVKVSHLKKYVFKSLSEYAVYK